jgi:hypothetical protein
MESPSPYGIHGAVLSGLPHGQGHLGVPQGQSAPDAPSGGSLRGSQTPPEGPKIPASRPGGPEVPEVQQEALNGPLGMRAVRDYLPPGL